MTKQSGAAAAAAAIVGAPVAAEKPAVGGHGVEATVVEQGKAIISMAKRAVEEEAAKSKAKIGGNGAAAGELSLKRSLECFLEGRRNKAAAAAAAASRRLESYSTASSSSSSN